MQGTYYVDVNPDIKPQQFTGSFDTLYVLLKALPPVCMKYTARDESGVANIAQGEAKCYICHRLYTFMQASGNVLSVLWYFTSTE